jgi:hypothetical protein
MFKLKADTMSAFFYLCKYIHNNKSSQNEKLCRRTEMERNDS